MKKPPYAPNSTLRGASKPMRRFNPEKRARRESEGLVYGDLHKWIKGQECAGAGHPLHICEYYPPERRWVESHHLKSVGSGGEDRNNCVPCCPAFHDEFHRRGLTGMCEHYGRDWRSIACEYTEDYDEAMAEGEEPEE